MNEPLVYLGEIRTCLLPAAGVLPAEKVAEILSSQAGHRVAHRERPLALDISSTLTEGVDCQLATATGVRSRSVGTVASRAVVVGGRLLQGSASVQVIRAGSSHRKRWSHYLSRVGTVELISRVGADTVVAEQLADGFLDHTRPDTLNLNAITERLMQRVRLHPRLGPRSPMHTEVTALRWTARVSPVPGGRAKYDFRLEGATARSLRLRVVTASDLAAAQRFCEDVAVHDWLLTTLNGALSDADRAEPDQDVVPLLAPMLKQLAHLWMPGAHSPAELSALWLELERNPGFSRQWNAQAARLRDWLSILTLEASQRIESPRAKW